MLLGGKRLNNRVPMADYLSFDASGIEDFKRRITRNDPRWSVASRPHGLLITRVQAVRNRSIFPYEGEPIPVRGRLSVWAEIDGERRMSDPIAGDGRRPYVAIALFAQTHQHGSVDCQRCYVHPCRDVEDLMMVDSQHERDTILELLDVRNWLKKDCDIDLNFRKPLFDEAPQFGDGARPILLPDFILETDSPNAIVPRLLVETMGYSNNDYRTRKDHVVPMMETFYGSAVVKHDMHGPAGELQTRRNVRFRGFCRSRIGGRF